MERERAILCIAHALYIYNDGARAAIYGETARAPTYNAGVIYLYRERESGRAPMYIERERARVHITPRLHIGRELASLCIAHALYICRESARAYTYGERPHAYMTRARYIYRESVRARLQ